MLRKILLGLIVIYCALPAIASLRTDQTDGEGRLVMYLRGTMTNGWSCQDSYKFSRNGDVYTLTLPSLNGEFKISSSDWNYNYGAEGYQVLPVNGAILLNGVAGGPNYNAVNLRQVTIKFRMDESFVSPNYISIGVNGNPGPDLPEVEEPTVSGTLPVLYINVYDPKDNFNNEIIDRNLSHKNYFEGVYWLDMNGCQWLADLGGESLGSRENPLPLSIKARGNFTRLAFSKKPYKLKLDKKQSLLGLSRSKHFALLAHADDDYGYLRNFTGFDLGRRIDLPWTPWQQPVEVVINDNYRGLYFLTESIRVEENRVDIAELPDYATDPALVSGGYLVELDNYDEENQIRMEEKSCVPGQHLDMLRITWDTPEEYSEVQKRFVTEQFQTMNNYVGANDDSLWSYMGMDAAVRYYLVEEIVSNTEAYHGSTYLFRNRGEGMYWQFSPLWDFGNAFNGSPTDFFYNCDPFGNTWIPSIRQNRKFNNRVNDTWLWFMTNKFDGIWEDIATYVSHISAAAKADWKRWKGAPLPDYNGARQVADNSDMTARKNQAVDKLQAKINWLKTQFGDFTGMGPVAEPTPDSTPAAPLPDYAGGDSGVDDIYLDGTEDELSETRYFNMQGNSVRELHRGDMYIAVKGNKTAKFVAR